MLLDRCPCVFSSGNLQPLGHGWEKGRPDSCPPFHLTSGCTHTCFLQSAWLCVQPAGQGNRRQCAKFALLSLMETRLCDACKPWPGSCQDMGLAERARTLPGCWRENTAAAWAPFHTSTCQVVGCHSSYFFFLHTPGSSFWQGNQEGVLTQYLKGGKDQLSSSSQNF